MCVRFEFENSNYELFRSSSEWDSLRSERRWIVDERELNSVFSSFFWYASYHIVPFMLVQNSAEQKITIFFSYLTAVEFGRIHTHTLTTHMLLKWPNTLKYNVLLRVVACAIKLLTDVDSHEKVVVTFCFLWLLLLSELLQNLPVYRASHFFLSLENHSQ